MHAFLFLWKKEPEILRVSKQYIRDGGAFPSLNKNHSKQNMKHILFTCPQCGSHELMSIERTLQYNRVRRIVHRFGKYLPADSEIDDYVSQGMAGFQCAGCMHPDSRRSSFQWKSWKDVEAAGCLTPDPDEGREKVACTVCSLDGRAYRTHVLMVPGEELSIERRREIVESILKGRPGVLLCERDPIEEVPSPQDGA